MTEPAASAAALAPYVPPVVLRRLVADPTPIEVPSAEGAHGACLLLDVSGFTALTDRLSRKGPAGAEEMAAILDGSFASIAATCAAHGGEIVSFEGDAALVVWWCDAGGLPEAAVRAVAAGSALQRRLASVGGDVAVRVCVTAGDLRVLYLGGVDERSRCLVTGPPVLRLGELAAFAGPGEVVADAGLVAGTGGAVAGSATGDGAVLVQSVSSPPPRPREVATPSEAAARGLRAFVAPAVLARLDGAGERWLAEFRKVSAVFAHLVGMRFDDLAVVQAVVADVQRIVHRYGGSVENLVQGEKGTVVFAAFGLPPLGHEDDPGRSVRAAIEIEEALAAAGVRSALGITTGTVFCGPVGDQRRRDFSVIGSSVNLAARLMQAASDDILCDAATRGAYDRIDYDALEPIVVKGFDAPVPVFRPLGTVPSRVAASEGDAVLVGRIAERRLLGDALDRLVGGQGGTVVIEGEAGIGKSRLIEAWRTDIGARGVPMSLSAADEIELSTPYYAWRSILEDALGLGDLPADPGIRRRHVLRRLGDLDAAVDDGALLNDVMGLRLPAHPGLDLLSASERAQRTRALLSRIVSGVPGPRIVLIEDAHWMDSASWALAGEVGRTAGDLLLVLATRPTDEPAASAAIGQAEVIELGGLSDDDALTMVAGTLGVDEVPPEVGEVILARTAGHPFFSQQLALVLEDAGLITTEGRVCRLLVAPSDLSAARVPDTVQATVVARIDRLEPPVRLTLRVAAVVGASFEDELVEAIVPSPAVPSGVVRYLADLAARGLVEQDGSREHPAHRFRHAITRDVAYGSLTIAQRRPLHRAVAAWLEEHRAAGDGSLHAVLAHHWSTAAGDGVDDPDAIERARFHLGLAGQAALRQGAFVEAGSFLSRALDLHRRTQEGDRDDGVELELLVPLGTATFATAGFGSPRTRAVYERAAELATGRLGPSERFPILWGLWLTTHFSFDTRRAVELGEQLLAIAGEVGDDELLLQAHHALWTTLIIIPDYERARRHLAEGIRLYRPEWHERHCARYGGHDPGSCAQRATALTDWTTGRVDHAIEAGEEAIRLAQDHTFSLLNAMLALAFVHRQRGDLDATAERAGRLIALARSRGFDGYAQWGRVLAGWATGMSGDLEGGIAEIEDAAGRLGMKDPGYLSMLVELYLRSGRFDDGLSLIDELLEVVEHKDEHSYEPELYRLRGELLHERGEDVEAEEWLQRAHRLADAQGAVSFSQRAEAALRTLAGA